MTTETTKTTKTTKKAREGGELNHEAALRVVMGLTMEDLAQCTPAVRAVLDDVATLTRHALDAQLAIDDHDNAHAAYLTVPVRDSTNPTRKKWLRQLSALALARNTARDVLVSVVLERFGPRVRKGEPRG